MRYWQFFKGLYLQEHIFLKTVSVISYSRLEVPREEFTSCRFQTSSPLFSQCRLKQYLSEVNEASKTCNRILRKRPELLVDEFFHGGGTLKETSVHCLEYWMWFKKLLRFKIHWFCVVFMILKWMSKISHSVL